MADFEISAGSPQRRLATFVDNVRAFLEETVHEEPGRYFPKELIGPMQNAWKTVKNRLEDIRAAVSVASKSELGPHGLTGHELIFKLRAVRYLWKRFTLKGGGRPLKGSRQIAGA